MEVQSELVGLLRPGMSVVPVINTKKPISEDHRRLVAASN